ncbi:MAG: hypothetical protein ACD_19C00297G0001, partial [uncultured bacterium]
MLIPSLAMTNLYSVIIQYQSRGLAPYLTFQKLSGPIAIGQLG